MGRPFRMELKKINDTFNWALDVPLDIHDEHLIDFQRKQAVVVGSGGSLSACHFLSLMHQKNGQLCKAITPLDLYHSKEIIRSSNIIFLSASGKNSDILFAHKLCIAFEPNSILNVCMKKGSPLAKASAPFSICKTIELNIPSGKDGFLATNSLIAYFTIISRLYNRKLQISNLNHNESVINTIDAFAGKLPVNFALTVLYAGWALPIAYDLESKFIEAGLGNIHFSDYRNFAHGRHNWFDKKSKHAAIIALTTPEDIELIEKTLALLPEPVPVLRLATSFTGPDGCIDLLSQSFHLVASIGDKVKIDPGRPGVPSYGSKLYNLKYSNLYLKNSIDNQKLLPIIRKVGYEAFSHFSDSEKEFWINALDIFKNEINKTSFGGVVLDYDGTLCNTESRFDPLIKEIKEQFLKLLKGGCIIGVATGRGKSVRKELQQLIDKQYWDHILIGYYNCSQFGFLYDDTIPHKNHPAKVLQNIKKTLAKNSYIDSNITVELKHRQIEIRVNDKTKTKEIKRTIFDILVSNFAEKVKVLESSHSMDIITKEVSKKSIIDECAQLAMKYKITPNFLSIGDKGSWPGNDYELLSSRFSLSVDEASSDPESGWNLASVGIKNVDATLQYFNAINIQKKGTIKITL